MAFDTAWLSSLVGGMIDMLPVTVTIGGTNYTGSRTILSDRRRMELYGVGRDIQHSVIFQTSDFSSVPEIGVTAVLDGTTYRVIGRDFDSGRISFRLDLGEEYVQ
jgi:hypothetical protein